MLNLTSIEDVMVNAISQATGIEVIIANQDAPRPTVNYATIFVTPARKLGLDRVTLTNDLLIDLDENIDGIREIKVSVNFFKDNAFENASSFETQLQGNALQDIFKAGNLGYAGVSDIRDISEINKELWEKRAQLDLTLYALTNFTDTVLAVDSADINGVAESGDNVTNININVRSS